jgi:hypothetical protein
MSESRPGAAHAKSEQRSESEHGDKQNLDCGSPKIVRRRVGALDAGSVRLGGGDQRSILSPAQANQAVRLIFLQLDSPRPLASN